MYALPYLFLSGRNQQRQLDESTILHFEFTDSSRNFVKF